MQTIRIQTTQMIELEYELAGVGDRMAAYILDVLLYVAYILLIAFFTDAIKWNNGWLSAVVMALPVLSYQLLCEVFLNGQSLGKRVRGIRVISLDGAQPSLGQYLLRWLFRIVDDIIGSGVVAVATISVSAKAQRVGDMVAGTTVVRTRLSTSLNDTFFMETEEKHQAAFPRVTELNDHDVTLLKEVINRCETDPLNTEQILTKAYEKTRAILQVKEHYAPLEFLRRVVMDYNYLTSKEE
jgi:uncharacterized RDD family membrane protein YckC